MALLGHSHNFQPWYELIKKSAVVALCQIISKCRKIYANLCNPKQSVFCLSLIRVHKTKDKVPQITTQEKIFCSKICPSSFIRS